MLGFLILNLIQLWAERFRKNIDAISIDGDRYSIKTATGAVTGAFYGMEKDADSGMRPQHWHSRINAYNLILSRSLIDEGKVIYQKLSKPLSQHFYMLSFQGGILVGAAFDSLQL